MHIDIIPHEIYRVGKREIISGSNRTETLTNLDLVMATILLLWLVMEEVCEVKSGDHVAVFSDNQPTVS